jgi:uncharacterized membrane protein HdeD (DUF308 family)
MKSKIQLIIGSIILILVGIFIVVGGFATGYNRLLFYGVALLLIGIIGIIGVFVKQKKAIYGYYYIISGIGLWIPIIFFVIFTNNAGGNATAAAVSLGLPALITTILWLIGGNKVLR